LPFDESDRLVALSRVRPGENRDGLPVDDFLDVREAATAYEGLAAFRSQSATIAGPFAAERARLVTMTPNTLEVLRVAPALGRHFTDDDARPGAPRVAMISHRLWLSQFDGDRDAIGRVLRVNGQPATIVAVAPERFGFPIIQDLWMPLALERPAERGTGPRVEVVGRLQPETSVEAAGSQLAALSRALESRHEANRGYTTVVQPYIHRFLGDEVFVSLVAMLGAVFGVMLIACANVANLQLARAADRTREIAVRTALGAGRWRIVRQLLLEGLLLASLGALAGLTVAAAGLALFNRAIADTDPPFWIDIRIDPVVLLFVTGLTVVAALAASLIPALRATRQDPYGVLKDEGRSATGLRLGRFGRELVVVEVLLSCCLLIVSGLLLKGVITAGADRYPYEIERVFLASFAADGERYASAGDRARLATDLTAVIGTIPGVEAAAVATGTPENGCCGRRVAVEGEVYATPESRPNIRYRGVTPGFFDVLGIPAAAGRLLQESDDAAALPVVVITADAARMLFPGGDAIGRRVSVGDDPGSPGAAWRTVVGVVGDLVPAGAVTAMAFVPLAQAQEPAFLVLARTDTPPASIAATVRARLASIDPDIAVFSPTTLAAAYDRQAWALRVFGTLFMAFGAAALLLATAGLYGVMAFSVRQRVREIGVRMALGARPGHVLRMMLWHGLGRVAIGVALGIVPAWWLSGFMGSLAINVDAVDPIVYVGSVSVILVAGIAATLIPGLRAASVDPLVALRDE
jgi:predicted permease